MKKVIERPIEFEARQYLAGDAMEFMKWLDRLDTVEEVSMDAYHRITAKVRGDRKIRLESGCWVVIAPDGYITKEHDNVFQKKYQDAP